MDELNERLAAANENRLETRSALEARVAELEAAAKERSAKVEAQQHELEILGNQVGELRSTNKELDNCKFAQEKKITEFSLKNESMKRELEDKEQIIGMPHPSILCRGREGQKEQLVEALKIFKANNSKMEKKLQESAEEINRGNAILEKYAKDLSLIHI